MNESTDKKKVPTCLHAFTQLLWRFSSNKKSERTKIHKPVHVLVEEQNLQNEKINLLTTKNLDLKKKNEEMDEVVECWKKKYGEMKTSLEKESIKLIDRITTLEKELEVKEKDIGENKVAMTHLLEQNQYLEKDVNTELQKHVMELESKIKTMSEVNTEMTVQCKDLLDMNNKLEGENDELRSTLKELYTSMNAEVNTSCSTITSTKRTPLKNISNIYNYERSRTSFKGKKYDFENSLGEIPMTPPSSSYNSKSYKRNYDIYAK